MKRFLCWLLGHRFDEHAARYMNIYHCTRCNGCAEPGTDMCRTLKDQWFLLKWRIRNRIQLWRSSRKTDWDRDLPF